MDFKTMHIDPLVMQLFASGKLKYMPYTDGTSTYKYHCNALPGTALTAAGWVVIRETMATGAMSFSNGSYAMDQVATDLAAVEALAYS